MTTDECMYTPTLCDASQTQHTGNHTTILNTANIYACTTCCLL
nr:MAG TPA: hypothetical protein [Caudoviricetes sp.]